MKFALSIVHTSNLSSKLLQSRGKYFNEFQPIPTRKLSHLSRFSYDPLAEPFCSYTVHMLKDVPPNVLAKTSGLTGRIFTWRWKIRIPFSTIYWEKHQLKRPIMLPPKWHGTLSLCPIALQVANIFLEDKGLWLPSGKGADQYPDSPF